MSEGFRCDGCKNMIEAREDRLTLDIDGVNAAHFHNFLCLYRFVTTAGLYEEFFPEMVKGGS